MRGRGYMKKRLKALSVLFALTMTVSAVAGCGNNTSSSTGSSSGSTNTGSTGSGSNDSSGSKDTPALEKKKELGVLSITFNGTPAADNEASLLALEEFTGYDLKIEYLLNSNYEDQLNTRMAAGNLPALVVLTGKTASVINNARAGAFWDITDHYKNYPNLAEANDIVMNNISIDGKVYGIYRARPLGRNGISYRKDWLENLGLEEPKTIDDLYNVLRAFTYDDPDQNGQKDTYGMTWSKWFGPLDQLNVALGGHNKWGIGADGKLEPEFVTDEYMESMKFIKKLYEEGLINKDFAAMETSDWQTDFKNSKSGVYMDVSDQARRFQTFFKDEKGIEDNVWVMGMVEGPKGIRVQPTSGHAGFVAITKSGAKTEADMLDALNFIDLTNTVEGQNLLNFGVEGVHYDLNDKGEVVARKFEQDPREGLNQFMTNVVDRLMPVEQTPIAARVLEVQKENMAFVVGNPCEPLTSNTYADRGAQLDQLISDARVQFVVGQLDEAGFKKVIEQWYAQGGQQVVDEYNAAYEALK